MPISTRLSQSCVLLATLAVSTLHAGPKFHFNEGQANIELNTMMQWWGAMTPEPQNTPQTESRADLYLRRGQLGLKGQAKQGLTFQSVISYDNAGKDPFGGTTFGSGQDLSISRFVLQEATTTLSVDSNWLVITAGLFRPQTSREFTGSYANVSSLDYSLVYNYVRQHLLTRSSGRETGLDIGGQWCIPTMAGVSWHVGGFDAYQEKAKANTDLRGHRIWSPLATGRIALTLGDMENPKQMMRSSVQAFGKRTGMTLGASGSYQGLNTTLWDTTKTTNATTGITTIKLTNAGGFKRNATIGGDILANWKGLALNGEYALLQRTAAIHPDSNDQSYTDQVWHARMAYAFALGDSLGFIEPAILYASFQGDALSLQNPNGSETQLDFGINYYPMAKGVRYSIHVVRPTGVAKSQFSSGSKDGIANPKNTTIVGEVLFAL